MRQVLALGSGEGVERRVESGFEQGELPRLGMEVEDAALSARISGRLALVDDRGDPVDGEHPGQREAAQAGAYDRDGWGGEHADAGRKVRGAGWSVDVSTESAWYPCIVDVSTRPRYPVAWPTL